MSSLLKALMRKGYDKEVAEELIEEMQDRVLQGEDPEEVLAEEGLEPDYLFDIITC